jgi:hypothetical protein
MVCSFLKEQTSLFHLKTLKHNAMPKFKVLPAVLITLFVVACTKDSNPYEEAIWEVKERCYEGMSFTCNGQLTDTYFKGKINGQEFCVSAGVDRYWARNGRGTQGIAEVVDGKVVIDPQKGVTGYFFSFAIEPHPIELGEGDQKGSYYENEFMPAVWIYTPSIQSPDPVAATAILDSFLTVGSKLLEKGGILNEPERFDFLIDWQCGHKIDPDWLPNYYSHYRYRVGAAYSSQGRKKENYTFEVVEYKKEDWGNYFRYIIRFKIECDLFNGDTKDFVGRLTDGEYRTEFLLQKEE